MHKDIKYNPCNKILRGNAPEVDEPMLEPYKYLRFAFYMVVMIVIVYLLTSCSYGAKNGNSVEIKHYAGYSLDNWENAIHKAEGNYNYGILSVKCEKGAECRKVCKNTVRNNYKRWQRSGQNISFLRFLENRYCPLRASNDPTGLNRNWIKNVNYYLIKGEL